MPRSESPCVVGCVTRLEDRRNRLKPGTCRRRSSTVWLAECPISSRGRTGPLGREAESVPDRSLTIGRPVMLRITLTSLVVAVALVLAFGPLVQAQQPPQPPPTWKQGQPSSMADSLLAPIAQPPAPKAPGEIPI